MHNLNGKQFGYLRVISPTNKRSSNNEIIWKCKCWCSRICYYRTGKLLTGQRVSCGKCKKGERKQPDWVTSRRDRKRAGKTPFSKLKEYDQFKIIWDYCFNNLTRNELVDKYLVSPTTLRSAIKLFRKRLNTVYELDYMANVEKTVISTEVIEKALKTSFVNEKLRDMLSDDTSPVLTDKEIMYCQLFVHAGSNELALKESGIAVCLDKPSPVQYQYLGIHLRKKPNIQLYIKSLQEEKLKDIQADKRIVQKELIDQISELREALQTTSGSIPANRGHILRAIELLGKTVGAFEDKVTIKEERAADALDQLVNMAKADIKLLPEGSPVEETYEVTDEQ